eukprot:Stramenopile-MAST_4_protein_3477
MQVGQVQVVEIGKDKNAGAYDGPIAVATSLQTIMDPASFNVLANSNNIRMKQGRALLEGFTGGAYPNIYVFSDFNSMYQQYRNGKPWKDPVPLPIFFVEEQYGGCCSRDFWCRICCSPGHPSVLKFYHASPPMPQSPAKYCCIKCGERPDESRPLYDRGAFMTLERIGLCNRLPNCFVCSEVCRDEMRLHAGDVGKANQAGNLSQEDVLAYGKVPIGGGGCTPTVHVMDRSTGNEVQTAVIEGPMCFGGFMDCCVTTDFQVSREKGKSGDLGKIVKEVPVGCSEWCRAACTTADTYDLMLTEEGRMKLTPVQKAALIGEMVHLDYMFFERDQFPVTCEQRGKSDQTWISCMLCLCYCYGCLVPCCITVPLPEE